MNAFVSLMAAVTLGLAATSVSAALVDFDDVVPDFLGTASFDNGGLTFSNSSSTAFMDVWDSTSPNSLTNNLIFSDFGSGDELTITRTGGGLFSLGSIDFAISWYSNALSDTIVVNGNALVIDTVLTTYNLNLINVSSVSIGGLSTSGSDSGYWLADNINYSVAAIPLPAALPLLLLALGGLGVVARRRRKAA